MSKQAVRAKRRSTNVADEIEQVYQKLVFWHCRQAQGLRARRYAARLKRLLRLDHTIPESIFGEECWSLVCEVEGDLQQAIRRRENEIKLIRRLHDITSEDQRDLVFKWYGYSDLIDRYVILADLYEQAGQTDRAVRVLRKSKALSARHAIPFDAEDILQELLEKATSRNGRKKLGAAGARSG